MTTIVSWPGDPCVALVVDPRIGALDLADLDAALPVGTEVVVLGDTIPPDDEITRLVSLLRQHDVYDAAGRLAPVVDAVKQVGVDDVVDQTLDRSRLGTPSVPLAVRRTLIHPHISGLGTLEIARMGLV